MKKGLCMILMGAVLLTTGNNVKAEWIKDQQGKWEYFSSDEVIHNFYGGKATDFVKPVKLPQYYQADARWSFKRYVEYEDNRLCAYIAVNDYFRA